MEIHSWVNLWSTIWFSGGENGSWRARHVTLFRLAANPWRRSSISALEFVIDAA